MQAPRRLKSGEYPPYQKARQGNGGSTDRVSLEACSISIHEERHMTVVRYEPWNLYKQLQSEINKILESNLHSGAEEDNSNVVTSHWSPAVDIKEDRGAFVLFADIPGVDPADIEITMDNGVLTIRGERPVESEEQRAEFKRMERARGMFYRRFSLPDSADPDGISARGRNGVLEITIRKQEKLQPRKITVEG